MPTTTLSELIDARAVVTMPEVFGEHPEARQVAWSLLKAEQGHPISAERERRLRGSGAAVTPLLRRNLVLQELAEARGMSAIEATTQAARPAVASAVARFMARHPRSGFGPFGGDAA